MQPHFPLFYVNESIFKLFASFLSKTTLKSSQYLIFFQKPRDDPNFDPKTGFLSKSGSSAERGSGATEGLPPFGRRKRETRQCPRFPKNPPPEPINALIFVNHADFCAKTTNFRFF